MKCDECDSTTNIIDSKVWWTAWGRNCFDFNWAKNKGSKKLCTDCEDREWLVCTCGALIDRDHFGQGYLPEDYQGDDLCPECAEKISTKCVEMTPDASAISMLTPDILTCTVCEDDYESGNGVSYICDVCGRNGFCEFCCDPEQHDCIAPNMAESES